MLISDHDKALEHQTFLFQLSAYCRQSLRVDLFCSQQYTRRALALFRRNFYLLSRLKTIKLNFRRLVHAAHESTLNSSCYFLACLSLMENELRDRMCMYCSGCQYMFNFWTTKHNTASIPVTQAQSGRRVGVTSTDNLLISMDEVYIFHRYFRTFSRRARDPSSFLGRQRKAVCNGLAARQYCALQRARGSQPKSPIAWAIT